MPQPLLPQSLSRSQAGFTSVGINKMNNFQLIEIVKSYKPLWDKMDFEKTDLSVREKMWDEIAQAMGSTKGIVKSRWKNLRDAYRKLIKKVEGTTLNPRWPYFKAMEFMREIAMNTTPRVHDISLRKPEELAIEPDYSITLETHRDEDPMHLNEQNVKLERGLKRHATDDIARHFLEIDAEKSASNDATTNGHIDDDDYQFLLSLYPHFKQVPTNRKLPLRMKIEQIIYDELYTIPSGSNRPCPYQM